MMSEYVETIMTLLNEAAGDLNQSEYAELLVALSADIDTRLS